MSEDKLISVPWQELLETLFRGRWIVLFSMLIGVLGATALVLLKAPVYKAQAKILLTAQPGSGPRQGAMADKQIQAELALLKSPDG